MPRARRPWNISCGATAHRPCARCWLGRGRRGISPRRCRSPPAPRIASSTRPGYGAALIAAFVGFSLIPTLLLLGLGSGLQSQSNDNRFGQEGEHALKGPRDVAQARRRGHEAVTVNSAKAISREICADDLLSSQPRETL